MPNGALRAKGSAPFVLEAPQSDAAKRQSYDGFWQQAPYRNGYDETKVRLHTENKGSPEVLARTKVTIGFGPGSANIKPD